MAAPTSPGSPPTADDAPTTAADESLPKMPSPIGWWVGGVLLAVGIVGGIALMTIGFSRLASLTNTQKINVPGTRTLTLEQGTYQVKVEDSYYSYTINPKVFIRSPDGSEVEVTAGLEPYNDTNRYYTSGKKLADFDATQQGQYVVRTERRTDAETEDEFPTTTRRGTTTSTRAGSRSSANRSGHAATVSVARSDNEVASMTVPLILGGIFGGFALATAGAVVLIVTGVRQGRAKRARRPKRMPPYISYPPSGPVPPPGYAGPPRGGYGPYGPYGAPAPGPYGGPGPYGAPAPGPYGGPGPYGAPAPGPYGGPGPYGAPPAGSSGVPGPWGVPPPGSYGTAPPPGAPLGGPPRDVVAPVSDTPFPETPFPETPFPDAPIADAPIADAPFPDAPIPDSHDDEPPFPDPTRRT